jgi:hypothetical protein
MAELLRLNNVSMEKSSTSLHYQLAEQWLAEVVFQ